MKLESYVRTSSIDETMKLLDEDGSIIIGGGAFLKLGSQKKKTGIDIESLGLNKIQVFDDEIHIGSMTSLYQLERSKELQKVHSGIISEAASKIMGVTVRNIATIGGSVCGRYGFSDLLTPLLSVEAKLNFVEMGLISLEDFLKLKGSVNDLLLEVIIPMKKSKAYLQILKKTSIDFSLINVAVLAYEEAKEINIVVGARPGLAHLVKLSKADVYELMESHLGELDVHQVSKLVETITDSFVFGSNQRASKEYRRQVAKVFINEGIKEVLG